MMLLSTVRVKKSPIHGKGLFATRDIPEGDIIWAYMAGDRKILAARATPRQLHHGYISTTDGMLVICGDIAKWWNFGFPPNCKESGQYANGERVVVTTRKILAGEELLISVESDRDARRKLML